MTRAPKPRTTYPETPRTTHPETRPETRRHERPAASWLRISAVLTLLGLALMVWAIVDPRATPVMIAMSVGQGLGTVAFVIYLGVVLADLRRARVFSDEEADP